MIRRNLFRSLYVFILIMSFAFVSLQGCSFMKTKPDTPIPPDNFTNLEKLIGHPGKDMYPEVSYDGRYVAYAAQKGKNFDIFYFDPTQPKINVIQVTRHVSDDINPAWSSDSKSLFFCSARLDALSIWKVKVKGGKGIQQITVREDASDFDPNISPDGQKMVFCSLKGKRSSSFFYSKKVTPTIWIANVDGSRMTQIGSGYNPRWSPDGRKILFHAPAGDNFDIWMTNPDGTDKTQLTTDSADDMDASWSPDGKMIVFASDREGAVALKTSFDIWVLDLQGTGITQLTYDPGNDGSPFWAKNGDIYFHSNRGEMDFDIFRGQPIIPWKK